MHVCVCYVFVCECVYFMCHLSLQDFRKRSRECIKPPSLHKPTHIQTKIPQTSERVFYLGT